MNISGTETPARGVCFRYLYAMPVVQCCSNDFVARFTSPFAQRFELLDRAMDDGV